MESVLQRCSLLSSHSDGSEEKGSRVVHVLSDLETKMIDMIRRDVSFVTYVINDIGG